MIFIHYLINIITNIRFAKIREALDQLMQEKHTWHLIGLLFKDRLECANQQLDEPMMTDTIVSQHNFKLFLICYYMGHIHYWNYLLLLLGSVQPMVLW